MYHIFNFKWISPTDVLGKTQVLSLLCHGRALCLVSHAHLSAYRVLLKWLSGRLLSGVCLSADHFTGMNSMVPLGRWDGRFYSCFTGGRSGGGQSSVQSWRCISFFVPWFPEAMHSSCRQFRSETLDYFFFFWNAVVDAYYFWKTDLTCYMQSAFVKEICSY